MKKKSVNGYALGSFWPVVFLLRLRAGITGAMFNIKLEAHGLAIRGVVLLSGLILSEFLFRYAKAQPS